MAQHQLYLTHLNDAYALFESYLQANIGTVIESPMLDMDPPETVWEAVAHVIGWTRYARHVIPQMLTAIDLDLPPVDAVGLGQQVRAEYADVLLPELLAAMHHHRVALLALLEAAPGPELTLRRTNQGRIFTIKSYVLDQLMDFILERVEALKRQQAAQRDPNDAEKE